MPVNLTDITPLILTYNEAPNIGRTLAGLAWADKIVVLDSGSTDGTLQILAAHSKVRVFSRPFDTHASQWEFALRRTDVTTAWVLALDADFQVSPAFVGELETLTPAEETGGYSARFVYCIEGRPLRGSLYPPLMVLFRADRTWFVQDGHSHRAVTDGKVEPLAAPLRHDDRKSLSVWLQSQVRYMELEARKLRQTRWGSLDWTDRIRLLRVVAPPLVFFYCLIGKGLILDGRRGLCYALERATAEAVLSLVLLRGDIAGRHDSA